jgi:hypothetical protein
MASPLRADPGGPHRDFENQRKTGAGRDMRRRRGALLQWWWGFWIVIFVFAIAWGIWGAANGNGWWFMGRHNVTAPAMNGSGVAALQSPSKQAFLGQKFQANFVPVQKKISDSVYWVGPKNAAPTLLVIKNNASTKGPLKKNGTTIQTGNLVDITGTVEKAPPQAQAQREWSLSSNGAAQLEREGGYIQGTLVFYVPQ